MARSAIGCDEIVFFTQPASQGGVVSDISIDENDSPHVSPSLQEGLPREDRQHHNANDKLDGHSHQKAANVSFDSPGGGGFVPLCI